MGTATVGGKLAQHHLAVLAAIVLLVFWEAVVVAFLVSLAVFIPASGWLGDHPGALIVSVQEAFEIGHLLNSATGAGKDLP